MTPVEAELQKARELLIDLTRRNRFLNYRPTKRRTVGLVDTEVEEIYQGLVLNRGSVRLVSRDEKQSSREFAGSGRNADSEIEAGNSPEAVPGSHLDPQHEKTLSLETDLTTDLLELKLPHLYRQANTIIDEQGYNALHLALPFIAWTESPSSNQVYRAPLLLIPVMLTRESIARYSLKWTGEEVKRNEALAVRAEQNGINFPQFEMQQSIDCVRDFLTMLSKAASDVLGWRVLDTEGCIDLFNFTKMVMYRDLDPSTWPLGSDPLEHPLLTLMFDPSPHTLTEPLFPEDDLDDRLDLKARYSVMDADPSQMAVIEDVICGRNLVVEGPPGTGKSQTIVNLIAELLADGKRVLFVSEKRAALEVVKNRLDDVGLGPFCLELHSRKATRQDFIEQIRQTSSLELSQKDTKEGKTVSLIELRNQLNKYADALRSPYGSIGFTVFELLEIHEKARVHFESKSVVTADLGFQIDEVRSWTKRDWQKAIHELELLSEVYPGQLQDNLWYGCNPPNPGMHLYQTLRNGLCNCLEAEKRLEKILEGWDESGIPKPLSPNGLNETIEAVDVLCDRAKLIAISADFLLKDDWNFSEKDLGTTLDDLASSRHLAAC